MNHIYTLTWNTLQAAYVPVPESARRHRPGSGLRTLTAAVLATLAVTAQALPTGGQVSAGQGSMAQNGHALTVNQQSQNLSINWQSFGIKANESVNFVQPNASAIALNRVLGADGTNILGRLNANGQVWLLNPNGVLFGSGAQVNVGGLVASTLNLSDTDFLAGKRTFTGKGGTVLNQGSLKAADGGYIALLGGRVSNNGVVQAKLGTVALGAGKQVTLDFNGDKLLSLQVDEGTVKALAQNKQLIQADGGTVLMSAKAAGNLMNAVVNNQGIVEARTIDTHTGTIKLLGENGTTRVAGTLDASAPNGGNGGFIETSGDRVKVAGNANITTRAPQGKAGQWLIDPTDYTIGTDITSQTLSSNLSKGNVIILSSQGRRTGVGDINVNATVSWNSPYSLTLSALHSVNVNNPITNAGSGGVTLRADNTGACVAGAANCGTVTFGKFANKSGSISINGGPVTIYYNPVGSNRAADANGNGPTYATPTNFSAKVTKGTLTAWMLVNDVNQLQGMNTNLSGNYALGRNIDASPTANWNGGAGFAPVGDSYGTIYFTGKLDGGGKVISGLSIYRPDDDSQGLFGIADTGAKLINIGLQNARVVSAGRSGGLVGVNSGSITNSYSTGTVSGGDYNNAGGLVGINFGGTISNSYSTSAVSGYGTIGGLVGLNVAGGVISNSYSTTGTVSGQINVGGLVGANQGGIISGSHSTEAVMDQGNNAGGLVGLNDRGTVSNSYSTGSVTGANGVAGLVGVTYGPISNSYSTGSVSGGDKVGGLVGSSDGTVSNSYSTGSVNSIGIYVGGLVGFNNYPGTINNSYSTGSVTGGSNVGGLVGVNSGNISNSYSIGSVTGNNGVGGLVGSNDGTINNSYYLETAGPNNGIGTPLTDAQMKDPDNYQINFAEFDFTTVWNPPTSTTYPTLKVFSTP